MKQRRMIFDEEIMQYTKPLRKRRTTMGIEKIRSAIIICPITGGCPTKMTKKRFKAQCIAIQNEKIRSAYTMKFARNTYCDKCRGTRVPPELEFITEREYKKMIRAVNVYQCLR